MNTQAGHTSASELKALILYWSATGNTEKVAKAIERGVSAAGAQLNVKKIAEASSVELYDYDLVFLGCPSYSFLPPEPVLGYVREKMKHHRERGDIKPSAPKMPGKRAVVFITYSGPHTGIAEAIPAGKYLGQLFEHIGFEVLDEWYVVGEFHGRDDLSTIGRMGDIRGRPNAEDLAKIEDTAAALVIK